MSMHKSNQVPRRSNIYSDFTNRRGNFFFYEHEVEQKAYKSTIKFLKVKAIIDSFLRKVM